MPFGPIFRAMTRNRARFVLIVAEVALTLAIVANCVSLIRESSASLSLTSGFDDENLLAITSRPFAEAFRENNYLAAAIEADARTLRSIDGVAAASNTQLRPWSGGGNSTAVMVGETRYLTQVYPADLEVFDTLGVRVVRGRNFTREEYDTLSAGDGGDGAASPAVISQALADLLFPQGDSLGKVLKNPDGSDGYRVVGVFDPFYNPYDWAIGEYAVFYPSRNGNFRGSTFLVRTEPGRSEEMIAEIERALLASNDGRNVEIRPIPEIRREYDARDQAVVVALDAVMVLLVVVTILGIVGITSFSVAERQRQIGTRRALGATRADILRHFLLENWMVTTFGAILGLGLAYALNFGLVTMVEGAKIDPLILAAGVALLWVTGLGAALGPALRAARVPPAIATRNV